MITPAAVGRALRDLQWPRPSPALGRREPELPRDLPRDSLVLKALHADPLQRYYLYVPSTLRPRAELVVLVHGISRNAREHVRAFAPHAVRSGVALLAPIFSREFCRDYQRLGWTGGGRRADLLLQEMAAEAAADVGADDARFSLFGHSGGAQFAHRFTFAWPDRVSRLAVCAAGYYTLPDATLRFPYGLRHADPHAPVPRPSVFLRIPTLVTVGTLDTRRDPQLRREADLDRRQGRHRVARARNWAAALRHTAVGVPGAAPVEFATIPGAGHRFTDTVRRGLCDVVWPWLTGPAAAPTPGNARPHSNQEAVP